MRSAFTRFTLIVGALAVCLLFTAASSWAVYRTAMGPAQCCKSRCPHRKPGSVPARCCQLAPGAPVGAGNDETARKAPARAAATSIDSALRRPPMSEPAVPSHVVSPPPAVSLYAQRTSLVR
jgi:hypothetical protein